MISKNKAFQQVLDILLRFSGRELLSWAVEFLAFMLLVDTAIPQEITMVNSKKMFSLREKRLLVLAKHLQLQQTMVQVSQVDRILVYQDYLELPVLMDGVEQLLKLMMELEVGEAKHQPMIRKTKLILLPRKILLTQRLRWFIQKILNIQMTREIIVYRMRQKVQKVQIHVKLTKIALVKGFVDY